MIVVLKEFEPFEKGLCNSAGNTDYSIPTLPSRVGMRDCCLDTLFSLGEACVKGEETLIRSCIYIKRSSWFCQGYKQYQLKPLSFL